MTWPNVLVLDYMIAKEQITPEIEMMARQYVNLGYQRLLTFESPGGGFDWYGREPGKPILTSYGLMEFADMERVHYVDPAMIKRTQEWLIGRQQSDGSWPPDNRDLFNALSNTLQSTAYATWALIHSGYSLSDPHIIKAKEYIKNQAPSIDDNYTLAICANALLEGNPINPDGHVLIDRLEARKTVNGDAIYWTSGGQSFTYSKGQYLSLETTAMAAMAIITANYQYPKTVQGVINYIVRQKEAFGLWGQTQATVLSLRVLMNAMSRTEETEEIEAEIVININGNILDKDNLPILNVTPIDAGILRLVEMKPYTLEGDNTVSIGFIGEGNLIYQIVGTYFLPWPEVDKPPEKPLSIDLEYDRTMLTVDDIILCTVTVNNRVPILITRGITFEGPGYTVIISCKLSLFSSFAKLSLNICLDKS